MYKHTQIGWLTLVSCGAFTLFFGIVTGTLIYQGVAIQRTPLPYVLALMILLMVLFGTLTVVVDDETIAVRFGPGFPRFTWRLADVKTCRPVKNSWLYGWGIRSGLGGALGFHWLYNVSGLDAVEIALNNGRIYRIGTDEPQRLSEFIQGKLSRTG